MLNLCMYFQLHQPYRIRRARSSEVLTGKTCFDDVRNESFFRRIAAKCYYPATELLQALLHESGGKLKFSFSLSGTWLSQCEEFEPKLLDRFCSLATHPSVEILCETSHHTLSSLIDKQIFLQEVNEHRSRIRALFGKDPKIFRNTELIYSNQIGDWLAQENFDGCLMEGWEHLLESDFNANKVFCHPNNPQFKLLPRCYRRSDDIAFRFSNKAWSEWPLSGEKYQDWIKAEISRGSSFVGLFMDFETLGEHQWKETGIFDFLAYWIRLTLRSADMRFVTPSESIREIPVRGPFSVPQPLSWADVERDVSAWVGSDYQRLALQSAYASYGHLASLGQRKLFETYLRLLTSDHFYYMSTKCAADGEVHGYFSPFGSPLEAYLEYRNALSEFIGRIKC